MQDDERKGKVDALADHMRAVFPDPADLRSFLLGALVASLDKAGFSDQQKVTVFAQGVQSIRQAKRVLPAVEVMPLGKRSS